MRSAILFLLLSCTYSVMNAQYVGHGSISQGRATVTTANIFPGCTGSRVSGIGTITATDSSHWTIPAQTAFSTGAHLPDLYNQCAAITPANEAAVNISTIPGTVIDADGVEITGYIFGDNYYELYINGVLVGVDPVPYTPFNSSMVKFKVKYPYTIAVKLVDWEENLGVGTEANGGNPYHSGDGGFIAQFSDGTVTDNSWRAQTFYIAPIADLSSVVELADSTRSSATAATTTTCNDACYAVHYHIPSDWNQPSFNVNIWPQATVFSASTVGVGSIPAFTNFPTFWADAQFIWSSNLILDNEVLVRKTVTSPSAIPEILDDANMLQIFPNPASSKLNIQANAVLLRNITNIGIYDMLGNMVYEEKRYDGPLDISFLASGIYQVKIQLAGRSISRKLIIE
jgi:Secretion system C-terminal sorting domain